MLLAIMGTVSSLLLGMLFFEKFLVTHRLEAIFPKLSAAIKFKLEAKSPINTKVVDTPFVISKNVFDAVYGKKVFSKKFALMALILSILFFILFSFIAYITTPGDLFPWIFPQSLHQAKILTILLLSNIFVDFASLVQTRYLLNMFHQLSNKASAFLLYIVIDVILSSALFLIIFPLFPAFISLNETQIIKYSEVYLSISDFTSTVVAQEGVEALDDGTLLEAPSYSLKLTGFVDSQSETKGVGDIYFLKYGITENELPLNLGAFTQLLTNRYGVPELDSTGKPVWRIASNDYFLSNFSTLYKTYFDTSFLIFEAVASMNFNQFFIAPIGVIAASPKTVQVFREEYGDSNLKNIETGIIAVFTATPDPQNTYFNFFTSVQENGWLTEWVAVSNRSANTSVPITLFAATSLSTSFVTAIFIIVFALAHISNFVFKVSRTNLLNLQAKDGPIFAFIFVILLIVLFVTVSIWLVTSLSSV